jgi:TP901 family phage tail tape measure protein
VLHRRRYLAPLEPCQRLHGAGSESRTRRAATTPAARPPFLEGRCVAIARALIDIVGDSASAQRAIEQTSVAVAGLGDELKGLSVDAKASAEAMVAASSQRIARLQAEAAAAKELSGSYAFGSAEQIAAANLYEQRITRISRMQGTLGTTADEAAQLQVSATMRQVAALDAEAAAYGRVAEASTGAASKIASTNAAAATANRNRLLGVEAAAARPSITQTAGTIGRGLTTYATLPAAFIGYEAIHQAIEYNQALLLIRTQAGATEGELQHMNGAVLQLVQSGHSYGQTAKDMADGLYFVESEGIRGGRALAILRAAAAGAAKGQTDMADTTNALTSAMKIWNLGAGDAVGTMATIDAITATGKMHLEDLNAAFGTKFFTTAKQLGIPLEQAGAALDVFTKAGVPAETAANNMTTSFIKMLTPAKSAVPYLQQLGLSSDSLGQALQRGGLSAALKELAEGYEHLVQTQGKFHANRAVLESFGGSRSGAPALALVQQYGSYLKSVGEIQRLNNPATFWSQVSEAMHTPAMQIKTDVAEIGADFIKLGTTLAPEVATISAGVADVAGAFGHLPGPAKDAILVVAGLLAVGGPVGLSIKGVGVLVGGVGTAVTAVAGMFRRVPEEAGPSIAATEAELRSLQAQLAATSGEVVGLGASFERLPLTAGAGIAGLETETAGLGAAGLMGRFGPAALLAGGGLLAGQVAGNAIPGTAGSIIGAGLEGAGIGAGVGMLGGPFAPISVPVGAAAGAGIGALVAGVTSLIHSGPSFTEQMRQMSTSVQGLGTAAGTAGRELAQLRLSRDELQQRIKADRAAIAQAPNSRIARDQLLADLAQLQGIDQQIAAEDAKRSKALKKQRDAVAGIVSKTQDLGNVTVQANRAGISAWRVGGQLVEGAKNKLQAYENGLLHLAQSAESSDPRLAAVYYKLHDIAVETGKIPGHKKVEIVVNAEYSKGAKELFNLFGLSKIGVNLDKAFSGMFKGLQPGASGGRHGPPPIYAFQLPHGLQLELAKASAGYMSQKKADEDVKQYILSHLKQYRGQALIDAYNELATIGNKNTAATHKAGAAARRAQAAFDHKVTEDQLLAKARLDLADGETGAARILLRRDQQRLQAMLAEASTNEERVTVLRQLTEVKRMLHSKADAFALSPRLQEEMARADALAALSGAGGATALQIRLAKQAKAAAMRAIHSHQLTMQGLTQAWEIVGQENAILAQAKGSIDTYHVASNKAIVDSVKGLTRLQRLALFEKLAQSDAHRGYVPNGPAADGQVIPMMTRHHHHHHHHHVHRRQFENPGGRYRPASAGAGHDGGAATIIVEHAAFYGVTDVHKLKAELDKLARQGHQRAGGRR